MVRDFQIDGWEVHAQLNQLTGPTGTVSVEGRSMAVLFALAKRAGEIVSRQELLDEVWGELFVGEEVLSHAIWDLRHAFGDDPKRPRLIHTHRKRGYRLAAKVSWLDEGVGATGRFRLLERVGGGAMGIVFRAEDTLLGRTVALKFLPPEWSRDELAKARFLREAKTAAALEHPNLCTLHEISETDDGRLYLVMPFYPGETLRSALGRRGALPPERVVDIGRQVAAGLAALHEVGIVHRDVKPGNVLLTDQSQIKLLDFGLAKFAGSTRLTQAGSSPGTPGYMSPEQLRGEEAGPASDVWSLGALLYEALSGRPPFGSENREAVFYAILHSEPEPLTARGVNEALARVIHKALARGVEDRFANAGDLRLELVRVSGAATSARESVSGSRTAIPPAAARSPRPLPSEAPVRRHPSPAEAPDLGGRGAGWRRWWPGAAPLAALVLVATAGLFAMRLLRGGQGDGSRDSEAPVAATALRVEIGPFENRTGDADLDGLALMAANMVGTGLGSTGRVVLLPPSKDAGSAGLPISVRRTLAKTAPRIAAKLRVSGAVYRTAEGLGAGAEVTELATGALVRSVDVGPAGLQQPEAMLDELRDRVMSVVSIVADMPYRMPALFSLIPRYPAYQELWLGLSVDSAVDAEPARQHLERALELEPELSLAALYLAGAPRDLVGRATAEELLLELDSRREVLTPYERHATSAFLNQIRGRWADALLQLRSAETWAPEDPWLAAQVSDTALWLNRPLEALEATERMPIEEVRGPFERYRLVISRGYALHSLRRYEEEADFARRALELLPNLPTEPRYAEVRALAALGRIDELESVIAASRADVTPMWEENLAWYLLSSALQLRAHGHPDLARDYAERALATCQAGEVCPDDQILGWTLWLLGRHEEAYAHFADLVAEHPRSVILRGQLGCLAALRGDRREAERIATEIDQTPGTPIYGVRKTFRGLIQAHLGDFEGAMHLLAEGFADGGNYEEFRVHYHVFLSPLLGYPPYEDLVSPKG